MLNIQTHMYKCLTFWVNNITSGEVEVLSLVQRVTLSMVALQAEGYMLVECRRRLLILMQPWQHIVQTNFQIPPGVRNPTDIYNMPLKVALSPLPKHQILIDADEGFTVQPVQPKRQHRMGQTTSEIIKTTTKQQH